MISSENRVVLAGVGAAVAGLLPIAALQVLEAVPTEVVGALAGLWFLPVAIAAPQLYLASRGVEPCRLRRGVAAGVIAFSVAGATAQLFAGPVVVGAVVLVGVAYLAYETQVETEERTERSSGGAD